ncbi:MAG: SU10 major capsid protein [Bacteroidales bacterium]
MTMLKTFDLKGNKQSFAEWISNLSPCETPFISMIPKEGIDQVQYSWQTDALSKPKNDPFAEGSAPAAAEIVRGVTTVHTNFTQIYRKAVRVSDTTKKISLYGRANELSYQMEKAGMEIKRDLEHCILNTAESGRPGTAGLHGISAGIQKLVAGVDADPDTGAKVRKIVNYAAGAAPLKFTQVQVFDMTYQLYLAGARADKVMVHPSNMHFFSDWIGANALTPHVHRMFDGMDTKYNAHVSSFRDPLGQVFEIIPNRYMPANQLFFFNASDWTQMILRAPEKVELAKNGSSEKHMIEMEVGLRHRNPYASAILEFNEVNKIVVRSVKTAPTNVKAAAAAVDAEESEISVVTTTHEGATSATAVTMTVTLTNDNGVVEAAPTIVSPTAAVDADAGSPTLGLSVAKAKVKHTKGARLKVDVVSAITPDNTLSTVVDTYETRDKA